MHWCIFTYIVRNHSLVCLVIFKSILQVLMKDVNTQMAVDEVRSVIGKCLENAALVNYTRISEFAKIEGKSIIYNCSCAWLV